MCLIIIKELGKTIPEGVLEVASYDNRDGMGVMWLDTFIPTYHESSEYKILEETDRPFIVHFRYATVGKVGLSNVHPFRCGANKEEFLMMNGTISNLGNTIMCDSKVLANNLGNVPRHKWRKNLSKHRCRFVTINTRTRTYEIYNKELWTQSDGVWYSKGEYVDMHYVAVYGTLKLGGWNDSLLKWSTYMGLGKTLGKYPLVVGGIPKLIDNKRVGHNIDVEVYSVDSYTMHDLDTLEGHPYVYKRRKVRIVMSDGSHKNCWIYFYQNHELKDTDVLVSTYVVEKRMSWGMDYEKDVVMTKEQVMCPKCYADVGSDGFDSVYCFNCDEWMDINNCLLDYSY